MTSRYLITGALGCIGAWTMLQLVEQGHSVIAADLGTDLSRLRLVSGGTDVESEIVFAQVDVTDQSALGRLVDDHAIDRIIHLAALQVPASHEDPPTGAAVNVVGTANILEIARRQQLESIVFASSVAVYGPDVADSRESIRNDADQNPNNFYGIFKRADEAVGRLYYQHHGVRSIGLRPHTVYGPGRDTGLTAAPTWAMFAKARGEDYEIPFSGRLGLQFAPDVAETFIRASSVSGDGTTYSIRGTVTGIPEMADLINERSDGGHISVSGDGLPFPADLDETELSEVIGAVPTTTLANGIDHTIRCFLSGDSSNLPRLADE